MQFDLKFAKMFSSLFIVTLLGISGVLGGFAFEDQEHGYVPVREGAHMFWWLYRANTDSSQRPLILWLTGGPGGSSSGHGNFMSIGPMDEHKEPRAHTWVKDFNVLFVDNPVGAGYSYVEHLKFLANDNKQIAVDLFELLKGFYEAQPEFKSRQLYIYGDGYGGKYAADFVLLLDAEFRNKTINTNSAGLAMGNVWASPIDIVLSYSTYLYELGLIDEAGRTLLNDQAEFTKLRYDEGQYYHTTLEWIRTLDWIYYLTDGVDFGNVITKIPKLSPDSGRSFQQRVFDLLTYSKYYSKDAEALDELMNGEVKEALGITTVWGKQAINTFENLFVDFMTPITKTIEDLLTNTDIPIHICNGNLDLIVDTPGQLSWIKALDWPEVEDFHNAQRHTIWGNNTMEGYKKSGGKLSFYWINVAGVDFINENPEATREFLRSMTNV